jgi:hypothetical protein
MRGVACRPHQEDKYPARMTYDVSLREVPPMTSIHLALDLIRLDADPDERSRRKCPRCDNDLMVHQPDEQWPDRLLGACAECRSWFLIDVDGKVMVRLPDENDLRGR